MTGRSAQVSIALGLWQDRPPGEALRTAQAAEQHGFEDLWIGEMATYDAFALAVAIGHRTRSMTMTLGPLAVSVRDPMMLAMGAATVADLTGRTVHLALGTSSPRVVEEWHGRERNRPLQAMRESLVTLRRLLDGQDGGGDGTLARSQGYRLRLAPPRSSITVAGFGPGALRLGATEADRVVLSLVTVEAAAELAAMVRRFAEEAGLPAPRLAAWVPASVDVDMGACHQVRSMLVGYLAAPGYAEMFERAGFGEEVALARSRPHPRELLARIPDELVESVAAMGSADQVAQRLSRYHEHLDEVAVLPTSTDDDPGGVHTISVLGARFRSGTS